MITKEQARAHLDHCGEDGHSITYCRYARTVIALHERVDRLTEAAIAAAQELRDDVTSWISNAQVACEKWSEYEARAEAAEADITTYQKIVADMTQEAETDKAELAALRAQVETTSALVRKLAYWLDTDAEVLADMDDRDMTDHHHIVAEVAKIAAALTEGAAL